MASKRKRTDFEKKWRRKNAAVENEKNARARAFKRINRSLPSEFEKEKNKIVRPHPLPAIVTKNMLVLAQRAGFLDPLKHLRVSNLETLVHVLANFDHPFVKTITDALEKYEGSLSPSTFSTTFSPLSGIFKVPSYQFSSFFPFCFFILFVPLFSKCPYNEPYLCQY
jgi:hypothetical protein